MRSPLPKGQLRRKPVRKRRATPRRSGRQRDEAYLALVRQLPCFVCGKPPANEPDHMGEHPYGRKANDDTAVPMCGSLWGCHRRRTDGYAPVWIRGAPEDDGDYPPWRPVGKMQMRAFCAEAIAATRRILGRQP